MWIKIFAAIVAMVLVIGYVTPMVIKLKQVSLGIVVLIGVVMMLIDLRQSLKAKEE